MNGIEVSKNENFYVWVELNFKCSPVTTNFSTCQGPLRLRKNENNPPAFVGFSICETNSNLEIGGGHGFNIRLPG